MSSTLTNQKDKSDWTAPRVEVGDIVLWADADTGKADTAAVVTKVGTGSRVHVNLIMEGVLNMRVLSGIYHRDDPELRIRKDLVRNGTWVHTPKTLALQALLEDLGTQIVTK